MYMLGMFGRDFGGVNAFDLSRFKAKKGGRSLLCPWAPFSLPLLYGLATALPVIALAVGLDYGLKKLSAVTGLAGKFEKYAKPVTAWAFIACGVYLGPRYIFGIV